eukprot:TRINITY_DN87122_c0_g1_i1.p1 TRINITY_DN87122_c0_g1~~TRINITY_DN87122_c0_g1_i1.p1  ORF type:complete len:294 (-),score=37.27 TRINITY_DN87122_c0_g1_i1:458-1339(-)
MDLQSLPARMAVGAIGGMGAAICCHPLDVVRVEMQVTKLHGRSSFATAADILQKSGLRHGLYSGLSAAFLRQWTYTAGRVGIYSFLLNREPILSAVTFKRKLLFGVLSGGLGSFAGTPAELALVRMGADAKLPLEKRRGTGVRSVLTNVIREEGVFGLWRGAGPTIVRAMVVSSCTLAVTSEAKQRLPELSSVCALNPTITMVVSTVCGSFSATLASQPLDVVKSRFQNMAVDSNGVLPYSSAWDCGLKSVREGPLVLMRGFTPSFVKLSPFMAISMTLSEAITKFLTGRSAF